MMKFNAVRSGAADEAQGGTILLLTASNRQACGSLQQLQGVIVDEHLKHLMQQLGNAINESLSDSENIAEVIGEIKKEGYDVFLVLEATIGFNKRGPEEGPSGSYDAAIDSSKPSPASFTAQDHAFLRALKITIEE